MIIDPQRASSRDVYRQMICCIIPRPIAWVSSISVDGVPNLAPFSFFNGVGANPPSIVFSPVNKRDGSRKDTVVNIEATREFVVNVVSFAQAGKMNGTSAEYAPEVNEFAACGLSEAPAERVAAPRVKEALVHLECVLDRIVPVGSGPLAANLVIGRIVLIHAEDSVLDEHGMIDPGNLDAIGRLGGNAYTRITERFDIARPDRP